MARFSPHKASPLIGVRQSERVVLVRKGSQMLLHQLRHATVPELTLASSSRASLIGLTEGRDLDYRDQVADRGSPGRPQIARLSASLLSHVFRPHKDVPLEIFPADFGLILSAG